MHIGILRRGTDIERWLMNTNGWLGITGKFLKSMWSLERNGVSAYTLTNFPGFSKYITHLPRPLRNPQTFCTEPNNNNLRRNLERNFAFQRHKFPEIGYITENLQDDIDRIWDILKPHEIEGKMEALANWH